MGPGQPGWFWHQEQAGACGAKLMTPVACLWDLNGQRCTCSGLGVEQAIGTMDSSHCDTCEGQQARAPQIHDLVSPSIATSNGVPVRLIR